MSSIFNFLFRCFCPFVLLPFSFIICPLAFAEIEITPGISVSETYYDENRNTAGRGDRWDFITAVSPSINLAQLSQTRQLNFRYSPSFVWYAERDWNPPVRHFVSLSLAQQLSQDLGLQLSNTYLRSEEPVQEFEGIEVIRTNRSAYQRNIGNAALQYRFGPENTFDLGYANNLLINDDPTLNDGVIHRPYMGFTYWFDIKNGIALRYNYVNADYSRDDGLTPTVDFHGSGALITYNRRFKPQTTGSVGYNYTVRYFEGFAEDYQVHDAFLGLSHSISPNLDVSLYGGYFVRVKERSSRDFSGFSYNASLNRSFSRGSFQISGRGGWSESYVDYLDVEQRGFTRFWSFQSRLTYQMAEKVNSYTGVAYRQDKAASDRSWRTLSGTMGLAWNFYKYFALSLTYSYINRDGDVTTINYSRNQIVLSLSADRLFKL